MQINGTRVSGRRKSKEEALRAQRGNLFLWAGNSKNFYIYMCKRQVLGKV